MTDDLDGLSGHVLIAMPGMNDPRFEKSVVFMCAHGPDGSLGLMVNKPSADLDFAALIRQMGLDIAAPSRDIRIHMGGPVEHGRGFVLHSRDYASEGSTLEIDDLFGMTATVDVLSELAHGRGPKQALLALGYAGWGPGQLESEIRRNGWLTCEALPELVFGEDNDGKWAAALNTLGVDPSTLSSTSGHA